MYSLEDYEVDENIYEDEDGNRISKEEAEAEVDWLNSQEGGE